MKSLIPILPLLLAWLSLAPMANAGDNLIVPGERIGGTHLGTVGAADLNRLPPATAGDQAMSRSRQVWVDEKSKNTLYIYTAQPGDGISVQLIRITSPYFETRAGIKTGSTLATILADFPQAKILPDTQAIYDDEKRGIAFEFAPNPTGKTPCLAIMIHPVGYPQYATAADVARLLDPANQ